MEVFRMLWLKVIDLLIPQANELDGEVLYRDRVFVNISISILIIVVGLSLFIPTLISLSPVGAKSANLLLFVLVSGIAFSLAVLRKTGQRLIAANILLAVIWSVFFFSSFYFGGVLSPTLPAFFLLPIIAAMVGGRQLSIAWTLLMISSLILFLVLERTGFQFTQIIKAENYSTAWIINLLAIGVVISCVVIIYAELNHSLRIALAKQNELLEFLASHDSLTKLPNRRNFYYQLDIASKRAQRYGQRFGLLMIDLNGFKGVNDTYGHRAGDLVLLNVAARLKLAVRQTDMIARLGGDEFVIILDNIDSEDQVRSVANKLYGKIEQPILLQQATVELKASIGASIYPDHDKDLQSLQEKADQAMYFSKNRTEPYVLWEDQLFA